MWEPNPTEKAIHMKRLVWIRGTKTKRKRVKKQLFVTLHTMAWLAYSTKICIIVVVLPPPPPPYQHLASYGSSGTPTATTILANGS